MCQAKKPFKLTKSSSSSSSMHITRDEFERFAVVVESVSALTLGLDDDDEVEGEVEAGSFACIATMGRA